MNDTAQPIDAFLRSTNGADPDPYYTIHYLVTSEVTIMTVPEPPAIALLGTGLLVLVLAGAHLDAEGTSQRVLNAVGCVPGRA